MKSFGRRTCIDQYSLDGIHIKKWSSIKEAASSFGFTPQTISNCLRGKVKSAHGYLWKYVKVDLLENEVWKEYLDTGFQISNFGRLKTKTGKLSNLKATVGGYKRVRLKTKSVSIHRMVATMFVENPNQKPFVNHINGNKTDNNATNLEWVTHRENMIHAETLYNKHTL